MYTYIYSVYIQMIRVATLFLKYCSPHCEIVLSLQLHLYDVACHSVNPETVGIGNKSKSKVDRRELVHPGSLAIRHKVLQAALLQVECLTQLGSTFNMDTRKHVSLILTCLVMQHYHWLRYYISYTCYIL